MAPIAAPSAAVPTVFARTAGVERIGRQRITTAAEAKVGKLQRYVCAALQLTRLLDIHDTAGNCRTPGNRQHIADIDALRQCPLKIISRLNLLGIQGLAGSNLQQRSGAKGNRPRWRHSLRLTLGTLVGIRLILIGLISRPGRASISHTGRWGSCSLVRILAWSLSRILGGPLIRILAGALVRILLVRILLVRILCRSGVCRRYLSILSVGRRPCRPPIALTARGGGVCRLPGGPVLLRVR
jgi:hypothetical protein